MTVILAVGEPQELLALVPYQLGFQPRESVVVVSLRGPRRSVGLVARIDLDDLDDADIGPSLATTVIARVRADGASTLVLIVYSDRPAARLPHESDRVWHAARVLSGAALADGFAVSGQRCELPADSPASGFVETWVVERSGYSALGCSRDSCCPPGGRPLTDLQATQVSAHMVLAGASVVADRADLTSVGVAGCDKLGAAQSAAARWRRSRAAASGERLLDWRRRALDLWRAGLSDPANSLTAGDLGRLEVALDDVLVRDAILLTWVPGANDLPERVLVPAVCEGNEDDAVARVIAKIVDPGEGIRPDEELLGRACTVLADVARHAGRSGAPARTLLALAHWWRGDQLRAAAFVAKALQADESYRLARILGRALDAGLPPGWLARL